MGEPVTWKNFVYHTIFFVAIAVFIAFTTLFVLSYGRLRRSGSFVYTGHPFRIRNDQKLYAVLPISQADSIEMWMTFEYINRMFDLPDTYIQSALGVTTSRYPKLTIFKVANMQNIPTTLYLQRVRDAVRYYPNVAINQ